MAYPSTLDTTSTIPVESANTPLSTNHITSHSAIQTAIIAIETLLGVTASAVTGTFNYILGEITGSDKAVGKTATQTLENKTLGTGTAIDLGSDAEGDTYYRNSAGDLARLPRGTDNYILKMNGNVPNWEVETTTVDASTIAKGVVEIATAAEIAAGTGTGGTGAVLAISPDQLLLARPVTEVQVYSTPGTASWTKPTNAKWVEVTVIGGGGAGGGGSTVITTGGGGGGGYGVKRFNASALGSTESYTVGAGGTGVAGTSGNAGGASSFGTTVYLRATGGGGGTSGSAAGGTANGDRYFTGGVGGAANGGAGVDTAVDPSPRGGGGGAYDGGTPTNAKAGGNGGAFITNYVKAGGAGGAAGVNNGVAAASTNTGLVFGGVGGGGAGYNGIGTDTGGAGGAGNLGSGGGGAAGPTNAGGAGGDGLVVVVTYF